MYLLYLDDSGNPDDPTDRHFVLAGCAIFERQTFHLSKQLDEIQTRHFPGQPPVEFHASPIRSGKGFWRKVEQGTKSEILREIGEAIAAAPGLAIVLFGAVIQKTDYLYGEAAVRRAAEEVCRRFDIFLMRRYNEAADPQRGLLLFAQSNTNSS